MYEIGDIIAHTGDPGFLSVGIVCRNYATKCYIYWVWQPSHSGLIDKARLVINRKWQ